MKELKCRTHGVLCMYNIEAHTYTFTQNGRLLPKHASSDYTQVYILYAAIQKRSISPW